VICASEVTYGTDTVTLPPIVALHEGVVELRIDPSRVQKLNAIGEQGFDDNIIFTRRNRVCFKLNFFNTMVDLCIICYLTGTY
jgi:hypothetical protein